MSRKQMIVTVVAGCMMLGMLVPAMAQTPTPTVPAPQPTAALLTATTPLFATSNFYVNVRSGPATKYTVLGKIRPADALDITGQTEEGNWLRVNFNGQEGWISTPLFEITGDLTTAPVAEAGASAVLRQTANQAITAQLGEVIVITRVNANLRATAATDADVLAVIPFDTKLTVTGRTNGNNWVRVTFEDHTGWLSSGTLIFSQGNIVNAPLLDENGNLVPVTPQPTVQPTAQATTTP